MSNLSKDTPQLPLLITPGEPAGLGPDLVLQLIAENEHLNLTAPLVAVACPQMLTERAQHLELDVQLNLLTDTKLHQAKQEANLLNLLPIDCPEAVTVGQLNPANAEYVLQCLTQAAELCLAEEASALITGPVHKGIINEAGIAFTGHTEFLQQLCKVKQVVMLLAIEELKVALVTTHLPLKDVPAAITTQRLIEIISILQADLASKFGIAQPKILVSGLNPHAGEDGHLGTEEIDTIIPTLELLNQQGFNLLGPLPADTLFTPHYLQQADAVLAMYHDQGLAVLKHLGFGRAANITLGLPIIRTSVDHGTALNLAGTGKGNLGSLKTALNYAMTMAAAAASATHE